MSLKLLNILSLFLFMCISLIFGQADFTDENRDEFYYNEFPQGFLWGLATSSYQIEGAWNINGKGVNIWDEFVHQEESPIQSGHTGDLACDSYHKFLDDVQILKDMGAHFYRFSLSWSRIIPGGLANSPVNQDGIDYYKNLIKALLDNDIQPFVTMYHWDLPKPLMDIGGWPNKDLAKHFEYYAKVVFENFGPQVKLWLTFNEPHIFCMLGYAYGSHAPGYQDPAEEPYKCAHTVILAHGLAYRLYEKEFKSSQNGEMGITLDSGWSEPKDPNDPTHVEASERSMQFNFGWFANPIIRGQYPQVMIEKIGNKSIVDEGLENSRLPQFTPDEITSINGTWDFLGLNHYSSGLVRPSTGGDPGFDGDQDVEGTGEIIGTPSAAPWLWSVPWGFRSVIKWINKEYNNPPLYITENGFADHDTDGLDDEDRVTYYRLYTNEMLKAIKIDNCNVKGYTAWSLMDNFEWGAGYTQRFGVHWINFTDPELKRIPKNSAKFLTQLFKDNGYFNGSISLKFSLISLLISVLITLLYTCEYY